MDLLTPDRLHEYLSAVCPIVGVRIAADGSIGCDYAPDATSEQIAAAQARLSTFDLSDSAHAAWVRTRKRINAIRWLDSDAPEACGIRAILREVVAEVAAIKAGTPLPSRTWDELKESVVTAIATGVVQCDSTQEA